MQNLNGKVVLITGAARGMGRLFALNFAREGSRVVITDVDQEELQKTLDEMKEKGYDVYAYVHDVSDHDACFELEEKVEVEVGPVDVLVNNAGIAINDSVLETSESDFRRITEVNYLGQIWMMQAFVPGMIKRGSGHVVNMCSLAGKVVAPYMAPYCATKWAFIGITDGIRQELKGSGVNFTIVNPGYINTGMFEGTTVPFITHWQDPQKVADAMVEAVKKNRAEICVPRFIIHLAALTRALGLPRFADIALGIMGANKTFATMNRDRNRPF